jgi:SAM-dependent methyltransferase
MEVATNPDSSAASRSVNAPQDDAAGNVYFLHVRTDITDLLPKTAKRILEIGCARGATLRWLKTIYPRCHTTGIEGFAANKPMLEANADVAIIADLDQPLPPLGQFDLIIALDVLEHLKDPDRLLKTLVQENLTPDGVVIVSLPAISHYSVSLPLLFKRRFDYVDAGIMDRTHLRFYVEESVIALLEQAGLKFTGGQLRGLYGWKTRLLNKLTGGLIKHWLAKGYTVRGERTSVRAPTWKLGPDPQKARPQSPPPKR